MSDYHYFELTDVKSESRLWRTPMKTDWGGYDQELAVKVKHLLNRLKTDCKIEHCANSLQECMVRSDENK